MSLMNDTPRFGMQTALIGGLLLVAAGFFVGMEVNTLSPSAPLNSSATPGNADLGPLFNAWEILDENFAPAATSTEPVTAEQKIWGAISGLTAAYEDPYTVFLPPEEKTIFETAIAGDFEGVGMEIGIRDGLLTVVAPLKDTPAYRAGITSGDLILKIDRKDTTGLSVEKAVALIRGPKGSTVTLSLQREDTEPFDVSVVRDTIALPTIETEVRDGIFVISIYNFNAIAPEQFRSAVAEFAQTGSNAMIIDLRGNPGGYLEVAVDIASWFLPIGTPIVIEDFSGDEEERIYRSRGYNVFTDQLKLAILVNEGSASASEILAGALHDHGKAILVGEKTFGKGSVQQLFDVTEHSSLKITVARWLTPNRISISHSGLEPDIKVPLTSEDRKAKKDPQMEKAVEYLKNP